MNLPEFGVKRPVTTLMIFLAVIIMGIVSIFMIPIDLFPEIENPAVTVITTWAGASTEDVETKVTRIIEKQLSVVNDLDELMSTSSEGVSSITCKFNWGTDLTEAASEVRDKLEFAKRNLPDEVEQPVVYKFNSSQIPIMFFGISARESWEKLDNLIDDELVIPLQRVSGVGAVQAFGALMRQIDIRLNRERLNAYRLTVADIQACLAGENLTLPAGTLKIGTIEYTIRVPGEYTDPEQIKDIPILVKNGAIIRMGDVAEVQDYFEEESQIVENKGDRGMMMMIQKRSGANTVEVANNVRERIGELIANLPDDIDVYLINDSSDFIRQSIGNVTSTVVWGGFFVVLVSFIFLRSFRTSFVIAATIPCSLIISFLFIYLMGWTINLISLASLSIAIGMVVDNTVVILENITSYVERGTRVREASMFGASEVGLAIMASTLTTIAVFVPMIFLKGMEGIMFRQLSGIITITLAASLICSLLLTPMLCSKVVTMDAVTGQGLYGVWKMIFYVSELFFSGIAWVYDHMIKFALNYRGAVIIIAVAVLGFSITLLPMIGTELSPDTDDGELQMSVELPISTRVEVTADLARRVIAEINTIAARMSPDSEHNVIRIANFRCGQNKQGWGNGQSHKATFNVRLVPKTERDVSTKEFVNELRQSLNKWPEIVKLHASTGNRMMKGMAGGSGKPIVIDVLGHDIDKCRDVATQIQNIALRTQGAVDPTLSADPGNRELAVRINREKAAVHGVKMQTVVSTLRTLFYGLEATKYREGEDEYNVFMQLGRAERSDINHLLNAEIALPNGNTVRLDAIAEVVEDEGPIQIERKNQERVIHVELDAFDRSIGEVVADIQKAIAKEIILPEGINIEYSGSVKEQAKTFRSLALMVLLGVLLVYMVMAAQFESLLAPFIIMFSVPFGITGVIFALAMTDTAMSMMTFIGIILLVGTVVNNAIVLIDFIIILRARGIALREAIIVSCHQRLRPILITTLTTIFGMVPMAFSTSVGSESWRPLGLTVIGGLSVSTLVTLILIPVLYTFITRDKPKKKPKTLTAESAV